MTGELAVIGILKNDSSVTAIVGNRITPHIREQLTTFPAITVDLDYSEYTDTKTGVSALDENYITVSLYGTSYRSISDLSVLVNSALDRYSGTVGTFAVQSIQKIDEDTYDDQIGDSPVYVKEFEFKIRLQRP